jgi:hypothetical protein
VGRVRAIRGLLHGPINGILHGPPESFTVANAATGAMMLWLLFFLLPVFTGLAFVIIDRRLRDPDEDIGF